jgi:hypothetical protein
MRTVYYTLEQADVSIAEAEFQPSKLFGFFSKKGLTAALLHVIMSPR